MNTVAVGFLVCTLLAPAVAWLIYRLANLSDQL
jgi:hypothetical protein